MSDDTKRRLESLLLILATALVAWFVNWLRPVQPATVEPTPVRVIIEQNPSVFQQPQQVTVSDDRSKEKK